MTDDSRPVRSGRPQLILVALVFVVPLAAAALLYYGGARWQPDGRTNHGELLTPIVNLQKRCPDSDLVGQVEDYWALVYVNESGCGRACRDALYTLRQSRLMLGNDMNRLMRVFLHGTGAPDTVFLDRQHPGMIALREPAVSSLLESLRPAAVAAGGFYLLDPLGNLVMYFPAGIVPGDMVDDLSHLLKLSRIG